jgi:hypothetical protein
LQGSYYDQKLQKEVEYKLTSPFLGGAWIYNPIICICDGNAIYYEVGPSITLPVLMIGACVIRDSIILADDVNGQELNLSDTNIQSYYRYCIHCCSPLWFVELYLVSDIWISFLISTQTFVGVLFNCIVILVKSSKIKSLSIQHF